MNTPIKVALIGLGGMGSVHYNCYKAIKNAKLTAVAEVRSDILKEKVDNPEIHTYSTLNELLKNETPDMIDICTPSYMHKSMAVECLNRGFNVLCEKPMSLHTADAAEIITAAERSGKLFMTAHVVRFMAPYMYLKNVIDSNELGSLVHLDMKRISEIPTWSWENWMTDLTKSGGTPLDLSIHDIDFVQYVLGEPKKVGGVYHKLKNNNDFIVSNLVYDNCTVTVQGAWYNYKLPFSASFDAVFQNGILELKDNQLYKNGNKIDIKRNELSSSSGININTTDGYGAEIQYFVNCIATGTSPKTVTPESSQKSVVLTERILSECIKF